MAEKTAGIPQSSNTGESVGRTVTGPLKRIIDNTVYSASRHATSTKRFLTNIKNSTTTPNMGQLKRLDETLTETRKQITNLRALPDHVNAKKAHPLVLASVSKDKYLEEMDNYLAKTKYLTAISICTELIQQIEAELSEHGQPASPFDESIHDANSAVEQLGLLVIDPQTGDLIEEEGQPIEDIIVQLTNELEETKLLAQSLEEASENKDGDAKEPTPLADTENEQRHLPEEEAATHLEDSNLEDKLKDLETEMEKVKLEIQEKAAEEKRLRDEILRVEAKIANRGVATPILIISIDEKKPTDPPLRNDDHSHPTILEKQKSSEHPHVSNDRAQTSQSDEKGSSRTTELVHQHTEKSEIAERKKQLEQEQKRKQAQQTGSELDKIHKTLNKDEQRSQGIRQYNDDIMPSEDDDDYAMKFLELGNRYSEYDKNGNPHLTPPSKTIPDHLKNVSFHNVHGYLVTFDGSSDFDIFRNIFRDYVIQNPNITSSYKLLLLKQHLTGRASKCLYRLEDTEEAIRLTFKELESKYGRKSDKMTLHNKFGSIPFHHTDSDRMTDDLRAHRMVLSEMKERGMNIDDEAVIKQFCTKLPGEMRKRVVEKFIATNGNLTFDMVHAIVVNGIEEIRISESYFEDRGVDYDSLHTHPTNKADNNVFRNYSQ